jgi:hypothetical protein
VLAKVAKERIADLRTTAPALVRALSAIVAIANGQARSAMKKRGA